MICFASVIFFEIRSTIEDHHNDGGWGMKINDIRCVNSTILFTPEAITYTHFYYSYGECYNIRNGNGVDGKTAKIL
jgi:hypothetical protein